MREAPEPLTPSETPQNAIVRVASLRRKLAIRQRKSESSRGGKGSMREERNGGGVTVLGVGAMQNNKRPVGRADGGVIF